MCIPLFFAAFDMSASSSSSSIMSEEDKTYTEILKTRLQAFAKSIDLILKDDAKINLLFYSEFIPTSINAKQYPAMRKGWLEKFHKTLTILTDKNNNNILDKLYIDLQKNHQNYQSVFVDLKIPNVERLPYTYLFLFFNELGKRYWKNVNFSAFYTWFLGEHKNKTNFTQFFFQNAIQEKIKEIQMRLQALLA